MNYCETQVFAEPDTGAVVLPVIECGGAARVMEFSGNWLRTTLLYLKTSGAG